MKTDDYTILTTSYRLLMTINTSNKDTFLQDFLGNLKEM